nr:T9SS type A sorting domain-containing protein [Bacteroidota bacterium]
GIDDFIDESGISIYPIPTEEIVHISYPEEITIWKVVIYNQTGQPVLHQQLEEDLINTSLLHKGFYLIELFTQHSTIKRKLIIR